MRICVCWESNACEKVRGWSLRCCYKIVAVKKLGCMMLSRTTFILKGT